MASNTGLLRLEQDADVVGRRKALLLFLMIAVFTTIMGAGIFFFYPHKTEPTSQFTTGTVSLSNDHKGSALLKLANMVAGDSVTGLLSVQNYGGTDFTSYGLTAAAASPENVLTTDKVNGLHLRVERCSRAWTLVGESAAEATCKGTRSLLVEDSPVLGTYSLAHESFCSGSLSDLHRVRCQLAGTDHLRLTVWLPQAAGNDFQGLSSSINFTFTGTAEPS